jgi:hypothetical protein
VEGGRLKGKEGIVCVTGRAAKRTPAYKQCCPLAHVCSERKTMQGKSVVRKCGVDKWCWVEGGGAAGDVQRLQLQVVLRVGGARNHRALLVHDTSIHVDHLALGTAGSSGRAVQSGRARGRHLTHRWQSNANTMRVSKEGWSEKKQVVACMRMQHVYMVTHHHNHYKKTTVVKEACKLEELSGNSSNQNCIGA